MFGIFTPKIGEDEPILTQTHIVQMGWFNHQPDDDDDDDDDDVDDDDVDDELKPPTRIAFLDRLWGTCSVPFLHWRRSDCFRIHVTLMEVNGIRHPKGLEVFW